MAFPPALSAIVAAIVATIVDWVAWAKASVFEPDGNANVLTVLPNWRGN
jgi:hypothetical protein